MILVSTKGFSGMPDIMVWPEIILDIALWVNSKMATISARLSLIDIIFDRMDAKS